MSRLLVLNQSELGLWRRDRLVRSWPVDQLVDGWDPSSSGCDGLPLLVLSGTVQSTIVQVPEMAKSDRQRYLAQLAENAGGALIGVDGLVAIQRIDGAAGLNALLAGLAAHGQRLRRVRHVSQLSEVVSRCLKLPSRQCLVGWESAQGVHLCVVRECVVLWHRLLRPDADIDPAFDETEQHALELRLFDGVATVRRLWLTRSESVAAASAEVVSMAAFLRALRWPDADSEVLAQPVTLAVVLASATSDFKTPPMVSAWRRRSGLRGVACVAGLCCLVSLTSLGRVETALATHQRATAHHARPAIRPDTAGGSDQLETRRALAELVLDDGAQDPVTWRRAVRSVAGVMSDHPNVELSRVAWRAVGPPELRLEMTAPAGRDHAELLADFGLSLAGTPWVIEPGAQAVLPADSVSRYRFDLTLTEGPDEPR